GVVIVLDTSGSMRESDRIVLAKEAVKSFVASRGPAEQIALVSFSDVPRVMHGFSADDGTAVAVEPLLASGETALWDAIKVAVGMFNDKSDIQPNVLVISDGTDSVSNSTASDAKAAALAAHVPVSAIGLTGVGYDGAELASIANATGGRFQASTKAADLESMFGQLRRDLNQQFQVVWQAKTASPEISFQLQGAVAEGVVPDGGASRGAATRPKVVSTGTPFLAGGVGRFLVLGLFGFAGLAAAWGGMLVMNARTSPLKARLAVYGSGGDAILGGKKKDNEMASSEVVRKAVEWTATAGKQVGLYSWIERHLEIARLPLRAAEAAFFTFAFAIAAGLAFTALKGVVFGFLVTVVVLGGAAGTLKILAKRTKAKFVKQLPTALQLLASSLRAGYSLLQGCESVAHELGGPFGAELKRVMSEARLGRPLEDALDLAAQRVDSDDFTWVVMAISIQREVGGNLAELLDTVADTMRARSRLRGEVKALTAEGRASAMMLGIMPPTLGLAMSVLSPGYLDPLFTETMGKIMLGVAATGVVVGFIWMQKIIKVEL
ncbi:MAG: type II secretion system F family protein, partial [Acidimicrobiales bacterium]|nr:type II secretion system F family protein [Acidimicrobiales bacterium]